MSATEEDELECLLREQKEAERQAQERERRMAELKAKKQTPASDPSPSQPDNTPAPAEDSVTTPKKGVKRNASEVVEEADEEESGTQEDKEERQAQAMRARKAIVNGLKKNAITPEELDDMEATAKKQTPPAVWDHEQKLEQAKQTLKVGEVLKVMPQPVRNPPRSARPGAKSQEQKERELIDQTQEDGDAPMEVDGEPENGNTETSDDPIIKKLLTFSRTKLKKAQDLLEERGICEKVPRGHLSNPRRAQMIRDVAEAKNLNIDNLMNGVLVDDEAVSPPRSAKKQRVADPHTPSITPSTRGSDVQVQIKWRDQDVITISFKDKSVEIQKGTYRSIFGENAD